MDKMDKMLLRMIRGSKGQFAAVLIIVTLGIAFYTALNMAAVNLAATKNIYYETCNFADLFIEVSGIPDSAVKKLEDLEGISEIDGRLAKDVPFLSDDPDERVNVRLMSTKEEAQRINKLVMIEGEAIRDGGRDALVLDQFAYARGIAVGDEIRLQIEGRQYRLRVCGIVASSEFIYLMESDQAIMPNPESFGVVYVSETLSRQAFQMTGLYNELLVVYKDGMERKSRQDDLIRELERHLGDYGLQKTIRAEDQLSNNVVNQEIDQIDRMCVAVPILFLLVAGLILMMMLSRMVKRDRIKIGILKALGYSTPQVIAHYVKYTLITGVLGGIAGIAAGTFMAGFILDLFVEFFAMPHYEIAPDYSYILTALVLSVLFCTVSGLLGARGAAAIHPAESMKAEAPKAGKRILIERIRLIWRNIPFSGKLVCKNVFRNKKRTSFVLMGVVLTYGLSLMTLTIPEVIEDMMVKHYTEFQLMDYSISFAKPVKESALKDLEYLFDDVYLEPKIEYPFDIINGNRSKSAAVVGIRQDTSFYSLKDPTGKILVPSRGGMLLSENLALALNVREGDSVRVSSYLKDENDIYLRVDGIVVQALGMNAYMEIGYMAETFLEKNAINGAYMNTSDPEVGSKLRTADHVTTVASTEDLRSTYDEYMGLMDAAIGFMVVLSGVLGVCIVYNTTIVSLEEREMEFSSLRVLGFGKNEIFQMIINENMIVTAAGILLGVPTGLLMLSYMSEAFTTDIYTLRMNPTLKVGIYAAALTVFFIVLAQVATYKKVSGLDFLQALKNRIS